MKMKYAMLFVGFFSICSYAYPWSSDERNQLMFICHETVNSGLRYDGSFWQSTSFNKSGPYYIYKDWQGVHHFANDVEWLGADRSGSSNDYFVSIQGPTLQQFHLQRRALKYTYVSADGFVNDIPNYTPIMSIGYCQKVSS